MYHNDILSEVLQPVLRSVTRGLLIGCVLSSALICAAVGTMYTLKQTRFLSAHLIVCRKPGWRERAPFQEPLPDPFELFFNPEPDRAAKNSRSIATRS